MAGSLAIGNPIRPRLSAAGAQRQPSNNEDDGDVRVEEETASELSYEATDPGMEDKDEDMDNDGKGVEEADAVKQDQPSEAVQ